MEWLEAAPRSKSFCERLLTASLPRWKTLASVGCSRNVFGRHCFFPGCVFRYAFSVDFGAFSCRGVPPELSRGRKSEPRRCQVCQVRFFIDFQTILGSVWGGIFEDVAFF